MRAGRAVKRTMPSVWSMRPRSTATSSTRGSSLEAAKKASQSGRGAFKKCWRDTALDNTPSRSNITEGPPRRPWFHVQQRGAHLFGFFGLGRRPAAGRRLLHKRHNRCVADDLVISLPVGARMLVVASLLLDQRATAGSLSAAGEVARAVASWSGPGAVVVAGNLFQVPGPDEAARALCSHAVLRDALLSFADAPARQVVMLPGVHDSWLACSSPGTDAIAGSIGAKVARAVTAEFRTVGGTRSARIATGESPGGVPASMAAARSGYARLADVVPGLWRGRTSAWLAGAERLEDPATMPRFVASRLVYRQFGLRAWLLALPVIVALPVALLRSARQVLRVFLLTAAAAGVVELLVLVALALVSVRQVWLAFSGQATSPMDLNEPDRALARELVGGGLAGLVTAASGRAELTKVANGFYANPGACSEVVREYPSRFAGAGLPSPFLGSRNIGWVELEAGNELHARLLLGEELVAGATPAERLVAKGAGKLAPHNVRHAGHAQASPAPVLVASLPNGEQWPRQISYPVQQQRTRRAAALVVAAAGLLSLLSAVAAPVAHRLRAVSQLVPLAVPQAAGALAALGGSR